MDMGTLKGVIKLIRDNKLTLSEAEIATIMQKVKRHRFRSCKACTIFIASGIQFTETSNLKTF